MKVKNIETHSLRHIWLAYVVKTLAANPTYRRVDKGKEHAYSQIAIQKLHGEHWIQVIDYARFKKISEHLMNSAKTAIIKGEALALPHCGKVFITRIQRDFRSKKKQVDWARSMKKNTEFDENGKRIYKKLVYFVSDDYLRVAWTRAEIPNQSWYEFSPAAGDLIRQAGFKFELAQANKKDPFLKYQYLFAPLKDIVKQVV